MSSRFSLSIQIRVHSRLSAADFTSFPAEVTTSKMPKVSAAFLVLAIAFIAIGLSGQRTFIYVGIVFLVVALARLRRNRR